MVADGLRRVSSLEALMVRIREQFGGVDGGVDRRIEKASLRLELGRRRLEEAASMKRGAFERILEPFLEAYGELVDELAGEGLVDAAGVPTKAAREGATKIPTALELRQQIAAVETG